MNLLESPLAVVGLGYVGLPLAVEFGKQRPVLGFDINAARVAELQGGHDHTLAPPGSERRAAAPLRFSHHRAALKACQVSIVPVPPPFDGANRPDLTPLVKASQTVGAALKPGNVVIYESTVYPGATEEVCVPELEKASGLTFNRDFFCGYSPERINPGDKVNTLTTIKKIPSGSTPAVAQAVDALYRQIITAGTHTASSIKVAEAAKVIENVQRDTNIALVNELSLIFARLGIDTLDVLQAAGTKWNFLPFRPGLVGGHCIGVDPYYLAYKAEQGGYYPEVILAGRRVNNHVARHVAAETIKLMVQRGLVSQDSKVLVLGLTFKENCPDLRNTKVVDAINALRSYNVHVDVYDPWIDVDEAQREYGLPCLRDMPAPGQYAGIVLAVGHRQFLDLGAEGIKALGLPGAVLFDVKGVLPRGAVDARL